jgi:HSP20 family protein
MVSLRDVVNSLLQESFERPAGPDAPGRATLPLDVSETDAGYVVKASLPGLKPGDVQVAVHGDRLTIRGELKAEEEKKGQIWHVRERRHGTFQRSLNLGTPIDAEKTHARVEHGVLTVTLPKSETARPRQIKVSS